MEVEISSNSIDFTSPLKRSREITESNSPQEKKIKIETFFRSAIQQTNTDSPISVNVATLMAKKKHDESSKENKPTLVTSNTMPSIIPTSPAKVLIPLSHSINYKKSKIL